MSDLSWDVLDLDYELEAERIGTRLREITSRVLHRRGLVVAISGGIDSSVCAALAVRALGPDRVFTLKVEGGVQRADGVGDAVARDDAVAMRRESAALRQRVGSRP